MNTVDALNVLGKALCGDSFEAKPGLTDAETILEIAKNYEGGGSGSGGGTGLPEINLSYTLTFSDGDTPEISDFVIDKNYSELNALVPAQSSVIVHAAEKIVEEGYDDEITTFNWVMTRLPGGTTNTCSLYALNIGSDNGELVVQKNAMLMATMDNETVLLGAVQHDVQINTR